MAVLLFKLRHVPEDEAKEVCELLEENDISFYETTAGSWGISMPAIWLHDDKQFKQGKKLIDAYQKERQKRAQALYEEACREGKQRKLLTLIEEAPFRFFAYIFGIVLVLYLATIPVSFLFR